MSANFTNLQQGFGGGRIVMATRASQESALWKEGHSLVSLFGWQLNLLALKRKARGEDSPPPDSYPIVTPPPFSLLSLGPTPPQSKWGYPSHLNSKGNSCTSFLIDRGLPLPLLLLWASPSQAPIQGWPGWTVAVWAVKWWRAFLTHQYLQFRHLKRAACLVNLVGHGGSQQQQPLSIRQDEMLTFFKKQKQNPCQSPSPVSMDSELCLSDQPSGISCI